MYLLYLYVEFISVNKYEGFKDIIINIQLFNILIIY